MAISPVFDPQVLAPHLPLDPDDKRYVERPTKDAERLAHWMIVDSKDARPIVVAGPAGSGKSTEIARSTLWLGRKFSVSLIAIDRVMNMRFQEDADFYGRLTAQIVDQALKNPERFGAILIEEIDGRPRTTVWHAPDVDPDRLRRAETRASEGYAYLVPEGRGPSRELDVVRRPSAAFEKRPPARGEAFAAAKDFILLPLITDHLPIAGALQVEPVEALDAVDLAFLNGVANQLAIALDRHNAWKNEVELRSRAEALAADNARLLEEARTAVQARDDFISIASHELRSPLTALDLQVSMLAGREAGAPTSPEDLKKALALVGRQTARLMILVAKLLDATRLSTGQLTLDLENGVDLATLVREVAERLRPEAARAQCDVIVETAQPVAGRWDRTRLEQVVINLLSNAVKYGAGTAVGVRVERGETTATLVVRDGGGGIAPEDQERIFARFQRAGEVRQHPGLGLGLYISREIVEHHGGWIRVESELGKGSTFTVELPLDTHGPII